MGRLAEECMGYNMKYRVAYGVQHGSSYSTFYSPSYGVHSSFETAKRVAKHHEIMEYLLSNGGYMRGYYYVEEIDEKI